MPQMQLIYHMLPIDQWHALTAQADYVAETLASEGFIHCTGEPERLVEVANRFYRQIAGEFVILSIAATKLQSELRWEEADGHLFPHVYGPVVRTAIVAVDPFPRAPDGTFQQPALTILDESLGQ